MELTSWGQSGRTRYAPAAFDCSAMEPSGTVDCETAFADGFPNSTLCRAEMLNSFDLTIRRMNQSSNFPREVARSTHHGTAPLLCEVTGKHPGSKRQSHTSIDNIRFWVFLHPFANKFCSLPVHGFGLPEVCGKCLHKQDSLFLITSARPTPDFNDI
jgi:hypothetical protein